MLPDIRSSSEIYGYIKEKLLEGIPVSGVGFNEGNLGFTLEFFSRLKGFL